ncbi:GUN4 domain-containing protein [Geminocystis sp. CENA526]|uniref:GUN4 domain-containing protein n=1 Tax=Geminocystis sp. CENA526 TaxID=1355871 RepID=UPI003D6E2239
MKTEKLDRDILGKTTQALIDDQVMEGRILAIARSIDNEKICFQQKKGQNGIWIPASNLIAETIEPGQEIEPSLEEIGNIKENYLKEIKKEVNKSPILLDLKAKSNEKAWSQLIDIVADSACNVQFLSSQKSVNRLITRSIKSKLSRDEIAHRLIFHKSLQAAGFEFFSDIIEAFNRIFQNIVNIPLPSLAKLSAEMIYQIAIIYGSDPESPEAKLEALNIFALTSMGEQALNIGLDWLKFDPALNKAVKVTGKAAMIYGIGYAACLFYKYKSETGKNLLNETKWLKEDFLPQTQEYLEIATSEENMKDSLIQEFQAYYKPIDYQKIEDYLSEQNWKLADQETGKIILDILTQNMTENLQSIPDKDWHKINTIWTNASKGKFGFTVQKQIYKTKTGFLKMNPIGNFGQEVGWRGEAGIFGGVFGWKEYDDLVFDLKLAPKGHLPAFWFDIYNDHHGYIVRQYLLPIFGKNIDKTDK